MMVRGIFQKKIFLWLVSVLVTVLMVIYTGYQIDWKVITSLQVEAPYFLLASVVYLFSYVIRSFRIHYFLKHNPVSLLKLLSISLLHNLYNRILPARTGELSFLYLLKRHSLVSLRDSSSILVVLRIYDLIASMVLLSFSAIFVYLDNFTYLISLVIITGFFIYIGFFPLSLLKFIRLIVSKLRGKRKKIYTEKFYDLLGYYIINLQYLHNWMTRLFLLGISLVIWVFVGILFILLMKGIGSYKDLWDTIFATSIANFSWILPINGVGGFGTMELSWVSAYRLLNYETDQILVTAIIINAFTFLCTIIFAVFPLIHLRGRESHEIDYSDTLP